MKETFLPFFRPALGEEEEREIVEALRSGWITTGPRTERFEADFATYVGSKYAVGVSSCTAGLHLALAALGIGPGDEVITTPFTFVATVNVIVHQGAIPVFVDVEPDTLNIDPARIEEKITPRTRAIMPVHFAGHPCEMDPIMDIAGRHGLAVIADAAHAVGAEYRGRKAGLLGDVSVFSFYATKNMTTGEGGMVATDAQELADRVRALRLHGLSQDAWKRYGVEGYRHPDLIQPGYKYNMTDLQAALGIQQLKKLDAFWETRKQLVEGYDRYLRDIPQLELLARRPYVKHAYHLYVILLKKESLAASRDEIMTAVQAQGIGVGVHFRAVHLYLYYQQQFGWRQGDFPRAEYASDRVLSLPLFVGLTVQDVGRVVATLTRVLESYRLG